MRPITLAATQFASTWDVPANIAKAKDVVRAAADAGANVVLVQELFETPYFCQDQSAEHFALAKPFEGNPLVAEMSELAAALGVVLPVSFFERAGRAYFNSVAMVDADGRVMGLYRKSHIPDGPGYQEKFYFTPGDTGFKVWSTKFGVLGCAICWDQWFPETARAMAMMGAEALFYPTAIGSEPPPAPPVDSREIIGLAASCRVMQRPITFRSLGASNRIGARKKGEAAEMTFYGSSFVAGPTGDIAAELGRTDEGFCSASFDLDAITVARASWGLYRDRRPELYDVLRSHDGKTA